ncbi:MAG: glycosyltransferase family 4 protein [candidate division Zixibacteria bacterium]|nr:glycosyltransferase family 4 protein [candidate division Zixibacteria bacterium]
MNNKKRFKVGIDTSVLDKTQTGTAVYVKGLIEGIRNSNSDQLELVLLKGPKPVKRKNILTKFINLGLELFWLHIKLPYLVTKLKLDLLHMPANLCSAFAPCLQITSILDANFMRYPKTYDTLYRLYAQVFFRIAAKRSTRIIAISQAAKKDIVRYFKAPPERIELIYPGLTHRESDPKMFEYAKKFKPYIFFSGALDPHKNLTGLVQAFAQVIGDWKLKDYNLVVAGSFGHDYANLVNLIKKLGLEEKVHLLGYVEDKKLVELYKNASLFVFPSLNEGFGFPPLEAMQYGVPVAASRVSSLPEVLGEAALFFDPLDVSSISRAIFVLLTDKNKRVELIRLGYRRIKNFSWESSALKTTKLYKKVLSDGKL